MEKIDFKASLDSYQAKPGTFRILEIPARNYLMIDGHGDPNISPDFSAAIEAIYPFAFKMKFMSKHELEKDYVVPPLEGLWWADDMEAFTSRRNKAGWKWTLMLMVPDWIPADMVAAAQQVAIAKNPHCQNVRLEALEEGKCVQTLHVGSYDHEGPALETLHREFLPANGLKPAKKHHEIYFSDFRKVAPEKLKTILRQPVQPQ